MDDGRSLGSALQPLKPISNHGVTLPRLSFLGNPSLQFCYKRIEYVALHQHGIKINNMTDWKTWMAIGVPGDKISSWLRQQMRDPHLPSTPCSLTNPMRVSPGPGDEVVLIHPYNLLPAPWLTHCGIVLVLGRMEVADQTGFPRRNRARLA